MTQLNRIRAVRQREGMSLRSFARQLGTTVAEVRSIDDPAADLRLSDVRRVAEVLRVPAGELVDDVDGDELARIRGAMIRVMRSVNTLLSKLTPQKPAHHIASFIREEIVAAMPEADNDAGLPEVGHRRDLEEPSRRDEKPIAIRDYLEDSHINMLLAGS